VPQHPVGCDGQPLAEPGQHPVRDVHEQPPGRVAGQPRVAAGERVGQQHPPCGHLGAGVAGAHHHEGRPRRPLGRVVAVVGQLVLPDDVVAQVERLGDVAEAVRVLGHAGHRQQLVDAAGGQQQLVVRQLAAGALRAEVRHPAAGQVDVLD
jgi:hypothetical protein